MAVFSIALPAALAGCTGRVRLTSDGGIAQRESGGERRPPAGDGGGTAKPKWEQNLSQMGKVHGLAIAGGATLVVSSETGVHVLLAGGQGKLRCSKFTGSNSTPAPVKAKARIKGGTIYFTRASKLCFGAIDDNACKLKWSSYFDCKAVSDSSPALVGQLAVIGTVADGSGAAHIWGVKLSSGKQSWHQTLEKHHIRRSVAAAANGTVYIGTQVNTVGKLYRLAAPSYAPKAILDANKIASPALITSGGEIVVGDWTGVLHAVDPSGAKRWQISAGATAIFSSPVEAPGGAVIVAVSLDGVHASKGGKKTWSYPISSINLSGVAVDASGTIFVGAMESCAGGAGGCLYAVRDGKLLWRFNANSGIDATPLVDGNTVYAGTQTGTIYALSTSGK